MLFKPLRFGGEQLSPGIGGILRERHVEYFPLDPEVSPVCGCSHSSLLSTSSPELPPLPLLGLAFLFLLFSALFILFLSFLLLAKALAASLMKMVA